jgi:hypothetical protein
MDKIIIVSNTNSRVGVNLPEIRFSRKWPAKGSKITVDKETFEQMMYDAGTRYMFESGMLYTEDLEVKKLVGLEPEDAEEPVNIIILDDKQKNRYMTVMPINEFITNIKKLGYEELQNLADYAIEHELVGDLKKCDEIQKLIGKDIIAAIRLNKQDKED